MTLPASGAISLSQVNTELGLSSTAQISLNDSSVRTLFGVASGAISMSNGYGKANQFAFTISTDQTNADLRTLAINAGWNQSTKVVATINSGVTVYSTSTGSYALSISGSFPGGVELINNGTILGKGGGGGRGGQAYGPCTCFGYSVNTVTAGTNGGPALYVSTSVSINNAGRISGGGGGGGGGSASSFAASGGGGGGGIGNGSAGTIASSCGSPGTGAAGTLTSAGAGGSGGVVPNASGCGWTEIGQAGGAGGSWASAGAEGGTYAQNGGAGGAGGACLAGNSYITWTATGTRNGSIS